MYRHAKDLEFEESARLRDEIHRVREQALLQ
jgi:excinuclease ABC subunit B